MLESDFDISTLTGLTKLEPGLMAGRRLMFPSQLKVLRGVSGVLCEINVGDVALESFESSVSGSLPSAMT